MQLPSDYLASRARFRQLGAHLDVAPHTFVHADRADGGTGGTGGALSLDDLSTNVMSTDAMYLGPAQAPTLVVIASGTHGVEGYAGAACQFRFMETYRARYARDGMAFLLVHAVNPWGFFHDRRVTREGVDLNRNFVDFPLVRATDCASDSSYGAYHSLLISNYRPLPHGMWNEIRLFSRALTHARRRQLQAAITAGQYAYPDGLFYGGTAPTTSRLVWEEIIGAYCGGRSRVFLLDLHTGLGKYGVGELLSELPAEDAGFRQMSHWVGGELKSMAQGESISAALGGTLTAAFARSVAAQSYAMGLEFGTCTPIAVLNALRADQWYHNNAQRLPPMMREWARGKMKRAFMSPDPAWQARILGRFDQVMERLVNGLAQS